MSLSLFIQKGLISGSGGIKATLARTVEEEGYTFGRLPVEEAIGLDEILLAKH